MLPCRTSAQPRIVCEICNRDVFCFEDDANSRLRYRITTSGPAVELSRTSKHPEEDRSLRDVCGKDSATSAWRAWPTSCVVPNMISPQIVTTQPWWLCRNRFEKVLLKRLNCPCNVRLAGRQQKKTERARADRDDEGLNDLPFQDHDHDTHGKIGTI